MITPPFSLIILLGGKFVNIQTGTNESPKPAKRLGASMFF
jgi:hypothetical protein